MKIITLMTDFGTTDGYVAAMKGVIFDACPRAQVVDAVHDIPAHDIRAGAWALRHYWKLFPEETIHVAIVDPGVGSARHPLMARADGRWLIGPDNGVFSWALRESRRFEAWTLSPAIRRRLAVGHTFHGRDVFAFAAGMLASGVSPSALAGKPIAPMRFDWPLPIKGRSSIRGTVIHIDRFGNAVTNIPAPTIARLGPNLSIACESFRTRGFGRIYADVSVGKQVALMESTGLLELAIREGSASEQCGIKLGSRVIVEKHKK